MSQIPRQHFDAPRQLPAAANGGGTGEYDLSTALTPYTSDQYSPPSPHRQYVGGYGDETALYHDPRPSNYPVTLVRDARALTDPSHPPPPPDRQSAAPESPWVAVITEMAIGVARIIPSLVEIGIAKAKMKLIEINRETSRMEEIDRATTSDVDSLPQAEGQT